MKYYLLLFLALFHCYSFAQQDKKTDTLQQIFQSLSAAQTNHDDLKVIKEANNLGDFYFSRDDATNALQYYETAFTTAKKIQHHALMGESLNNMGAVYQFQTDYKKAINAYSRAAEMYTKAKNDALLASTLNLLGKATALSHNYKKSYKIYETANSKARKANDQKAIVESYGGMATALQKMGSRKYAAHYNKLYEDAKKKLEEAEQPPVIANSAQPEKEVGVAVNNAPEQKTVTSIVSESGVVSNTFYVLNAGILLLGFGLMIWWFRNRMHGLKNRIDAEQAARDAAQQDRIRTLLGIRDDLHSDLALIRSANRNSTPMNSVDLTAKDENVAHALQNMNENIDDMVWALDTHHITVATLLTDLHQYASNYFAVQPVRLVFDFPEESPQIQITKECYRALFLAVKETFHNITNHSGASEVIVKAGISDDYFSVSVMDNGEVFDFAPSKADRIASMEARFEKIGGKFKLFRKPAHGSHITIGLPLRKSVGAH